MKYFLVSSKLFSNTIDISLYKIRLFFPVAGSMQMPVPAKNGQAQQQAVNDKDIKTMRFDIFH